MLARVIENGRFDDPIQCWLCGAAAGAVRAPEGGYSRVACGQCGAVYVSPLLSDAGARAVYGKETRWSLGSGLDKGVDGVGQIYEGRRSAVYDRIAGELRRLLGQPGRLLDAGCGAGAFLLWMRRAGWRASGVDINPDMVAICRGRGLDVRLGAVDALEPSEGAFDCISFLNALGYIADPIGAIRAAAQLLRPGGVVVVEDPNGVFHGPVRRLFDLLRMPEKGLTVAPRPPRRLFVLGPSSYRLLFERVGLQPIEILPSRARPEGAAWAIAARRSLYAAGEVVYRVTAGRALLTPSLLAFGRAGVTADRAGVVSRPAPRRAG